MQFPNDVQAALLFDRPVAVLDAAVRNFQRIEEARSGACFAIPEAKPGTFYRVFGGGELMITLEYVAAPARAEVFQQTLASAVTGILCPDIRERLTRHQSHVLINVSHGVLGGAASPDISKFLQQINYRMEGQSLPEFIRRLEVCALIARIVSDEAEPQAVHWTQSNQLIPGEMFDRYAQGQAPTPLHVHPYLFGRDKAADGTPMVGIRTFGVRHFIGREVLVEPNVLPWAANFDTILAFLRVATMKDGYIIPDGDTFGPEDRSLSYRVIHREAEEDDVPLFVLEPLLYREFDFVADGYVPPERVFDDRSPPADLMPRSDEEKFELVNEWREKRAMAERAGARFEVRAKGPPGAAPTPPAPGGAPFGGGFGARPVFGRKRG